MILLMSHGSARDDHLDAGHEMSMMGTALWIALVTATLAVAVTLAARILWPSTSRWALDDKVVVITGGAHGLGRSLAETILSSATRCTVVLIDVDAPALERTRRELGELAIAREGALLGFACDVSDEIAVKTCMAEILAAIAPRRVDVLVNNAGIVSGASLEDLTPAQIRRTIEVNTLSHFWTTKIVLPTMKEARRGLIVTISSVMGLIPGANLTDYCASKFALCGFHEALRLELYRDGFGRDIRLLMVCPNALDTGMFKGIMDGDSFTCRLSRLLLPMSSERTAAARVHRAMLNGEELVVSVYSGLWGAIIPWLPAVAHLFPPWIVDRIVHLGGGVYGMDTFIGRKEKAT